ncbi:MAG TPA: sugar phosphate isomerase/epimerase family protein [Bryobacteraceae bacterium]|nr:sugar phosphate isomerase/epimerase family protein [Bryobacteraceae bacterium]
MKYGVNAFIWTANFGPSDLPLLPPIKQHGFDGVEVGIFAAPTFPAAAIRKGVEASGLECTCCSVLPEGLHAGSSDPEIRRKTVQHLSACVQAVAEAGSKIIAGPLYSPVGYLPGRRRTTDEWRWAVESFQALGPVGTECGVTLCLEPLNRFETYFLNTASDAAAFCDAVNHPNIGILFDTFHANIEERDIAQGFRTVAKHLKHVHTCENDRGAPGSGHVEWDAVFAALRDVGYDGWLTIESFGFSLGALSAAASIWRDIAPTPESIAWDGIQFLKRKMSAAAAR